MTTSIHSPTENDSIWREYYQKALSRRHAQRTEQAIKLNQSGILAATDCGCGTGSDIQYLSQNGYQVHGFDCNPDAIQLCQQRFSSDPLIDIRQSSFEHYDYPTCGVLLAHNSLFFANPESFTQTWQNLSNSIAAGGVFSGDFMGVNDSWAHKYRSPTAPLTKASVLALLVDFDIINFHERDETGQTALGRNKHWHTFTVMAQKR